MLNQFKRITHKSIEQVRKHPIIALTVLASIGFLGHEIYKAWEIYNNPVVPPPIESQNFRGFMRLVTHLIHEDIARTYNILAYKTFMWFDSLEPNHPSFAEKGTRILDAINRILTKGEKAVFGYSINTVPPTPTPTPMP